MRLIDIPIIFLILLIFGIGLTGVYHLFLVVPFIPTPKKVGETMIAFSGLKNGETFYDLGAGDGRLLIAAKRQLPRIRAVGYEVVPTIWLFGKLRIWLSKMKVEFYRRNYLKADLSDADCIFVYLMTDAMKVLQAKFDRELKPGTVVVSYAFKFPSREPVDHLSVPWIQGERNLWKYIW